MVLTMKTTTLWFFGIVLCSSALLAPPGPRFIAKELLGRPTNVSVTVSVMAEKNIEVYFEYGTTSGSYTGKTATVRAAGNTQIEAIIGELQPDTAYYYRMRYREPGSGAFADGGEHFFHTARPRGAAFTFAVQADPHLDDGSDPVVYKETLQNELQAKPDFLIDLGDTFMSDKLPDPTYDAIVKRHLLARSYYELVCHSVPLFLALGNHEGETGRRLDGTPNNLAVWAAKARKLYYPNPEPDSFYTGSSKVEEFVGLRQNYYAWEWGDALFVVLDPFWYSTGGGRQNGDNWYWTLGRDQYNWLKQTLEASKSKFKFVFAHHLIGGLNLDGVARGGIEGVPYFEWGGHNADGTWGFNEKRPGWDLPIHQLLVKNNVTIFFHGHDHMYAKQDLDGIVYQEVPQPSHGASRGGGRTGQYGYTHGKILSGSGYMRVMVSPSKVDVNYIRSASGRPGGEIADTYALNARAGNTSVSPTTMPGSNVDPVPVADQGQPNRRRKGPPLGQAPPPAETK
jgi:hypothetical protein